MSDLDSNSHDMGSPPTDGADTAADRPDRSAFLRSIGTGVLGAGAVLATAQSAHAAGIVLNEEQLAKLSPTALKRVLLQLRHEDEMVAGGPGRFGNSAYADHDSHVMFGSHSSHGSHGQHTSFTNAMA